MSKDIVKADLITYEEIDNQDYCIEDVADLRRAYDDAQSDINRLHEYIEGLQRSACDE
jgi:hypothetical protein